MIYFGIASLALAGAVELRFERQQLPALRDQHHLDGAGCWLHPMGGHYEQDDVFQWNIAGRAWINIDNTDVELNMVSSKQFPLRKDKTTVGDRRVSEFAGPGIKVVLETTTTKTCPGDDDSCEVFSEEGVIKVTVGRKSWNMRVEGECGS